MTNRYSIVIVAVCVLLALGSWIVLENSRTVTASHIASLSTPLPNTIHLPLLAKNYQPPPDPFLRAPYYGTWNLSCVFDHDLPIHVGQSSTPGVTHFNGFTSTVCYDGHNGYDYYSVSRYGPVLAAGDGIVSEVRWNYPDNHRKGLGIFVRIAHDSDYTTLYGHLSTALVSAGTVITNSTDGQILGISGNTGSVSSSSGCDPNTDPMCAGHLHLRLDATTSW